MTQIEKQDQQSRLNNKILRQRMRDAGLSIYPATNGRYVMRDEVYDSFQDAYKAAFAILASLSS